MAYVFRIHEASRKGQVSPKPAANVKHWDVTAPIAGALLNNIELGNANAKMGTSIPSLFARLYLFGGAFQSLAGDGDVAFNNLDQKINATLISDCLDLLEFLYQHGGDPHLVIRHWNANDQIQILMNDQNASHKKLAEVIKDEIATNPNLQNLFLFYWKSSTAKSVQPIEILIGGTSPYSLVFTSVNWKREMAAHGLTFHRLDGTKMFDENAIQPLTQRDSKFKDMIYSLYIAYQAFLPQMAQAFNNYIATCWNAEIFKAPEIITMNPQIFGSTYTLIKDINGAPIQIGDIPISYEQVSLAKSGYLIRATTQRFHAQGNVDIPLVLNDYGIQGAPYVGKSVWNMQTCIINETVIKGMDLIQRTLPGGMGIQYPFLVASDFLEDKILKVSYDLDKAHFITASAGDSQYLLPLKKEFFNYFNVSDIDSVVYSIGGKQKKLVEITPIKNGVEVVLNIPIAYNGSTIELKRVYTGDYVVETTSLLGFFPFYRVTNNAILNRYNIVAGSRDDVSLDFYNQNDIQKSIPCSSQVRTAMQIVTTYTKYYKVTSSFDFIALKCGKNGPKGLLIPRMREVNIANASEKFSFAVDLGTSNTYIAYITNKNPEPVSFNITPQDAQVVFTGNIEAVADLKAYIDREFVPSLIGQDPKAWAKYPIRTATCETNGFKNQVADLFGNISIGYKLQSEEVISSAYQIPFVYCTDLKWALEKNPADQHSLSRVQNFCLETLWVLKNKSILNGGDENFDVYITFPETMTVPTKNLLKNQCWDWAKQQLNLPNCQIYVESESIAPYNKLAPTTKGQSLLNIDVGGGTSDLLFVCKDPVNGQINQAYYTSVRFAANDLWGDGIATGAPTQMQNSFYKEARQRIDQNASNYPRNLIDNLNSLETYTKSSADAMGFLFKHDDIFNESTSIRSNDKLYSLVFIHYAALMYYVARLIKKADIGIPEYLSFTGMGSRYINIISTDTNDIKDLTVLLLEKYSGKKASVNFCIFMEPEAKEVTAKGALMGLNLNANFQIPTGILKELTDYGFDTRQTLTYGNVSEEQVSTAVINEFCNFIDSLCDDKFKNYIFQKYALNIPNDLISKLKSLAGQSYANVCASKPATHAAFDLRETLFFWPLKDILPTL